MQTTDTTSQLLRLYYLQQLGVTPWLPRVSLRGALEVEDAFEADVERETDVGSGGPLVTAQVIGPEPATSKPVVAREIPVEEPTAAQRLAHKVAVKTPAIDEQALSPFQILFMVISAELALALQIPSAMKPVLREADARLLANILRWLGFAWPSQVTPLQFHWPLPGLSATSATEAGKGLQVFLDQAAQEREFKRLVVFGAEPAAALRASGKPQNTWQAWYTHSLAELLAVPVLKHEAWQVLIPLRSSLSS